MSYECFAESYDRLTGNVDYPGMAAFLRDIILRLKPDCSLVLDMACGTGSLAIELQKLGFDMTAADGSYEMLSCAMNKGAEGILFLRQRMEKLDMYGTMGAIVCTLDSVNHVTDPAVLAEIFRRACMFLDDDGVFIFDANTPYKHREILADNTFVYDLDDVYCVWQNETNDELLTEISLDFFKLDKESGMYDRSGESFCERAYTDEQLCEMLANAGLTVAERYDDYSAASPSDATQRIVYVCRKTATD